MRVEETVYSETEEYETEYACKLVREQASTEETMVVKLMIRKPGTEEPNGTSTTCLEITGTKSVTKELVVKRQSFTTVPKNRVVERKSKSKMESSTVDAKDLRLTHPKSMSLKEALDSVKESRGVPSRLRISASRPLSDQKVAQRRNISPHPNHRPHTPIRDQSSRHAASPKTELDYASFLKRPAPSKPLWRESQLEASTDDKFKSTEISRKRSLGHPQFTIKRPVPSWSFLLRRPMYRQIMTVSPISQLNMSPKCSDFISAIVNRCPLERYLATRSAKRRSVRPAVKKYPVTRTASPSIRVTGLKYYNLIDSRSTALSADTHRLMTGPPLTGNIVEIERRLPPTQSLSKLKMPTVLKVNQQIYPFKLIPSPAEERPLETSIPLSL
jgi:hypothetical protein